MLHALGAALERMGQLLRLRTLRMPRMLQRRGVDVGAYVDTLSPGQLREHLRNCARCGAALGDLCDRDLKSGRARRPGAFSYCPNRDAVQRYLARKRSA